MIEELILWRPIYAQTATTDISGVNDLDLLWERLDMMEELRQSI